MRSLVPERLTNVNCLTTEGTRIARCFLRESRGDVRTPPIKSKKASRSKLRFFSDLRLTRHDDDMELHM